MRLPSKTRPSLGHMLLLAALGAHIPALEAQQTAVDASKDVAGSEQGFMLLLEFIGEFTDEDGQWLDPIVLEQELSSLDDGTDGSETGKMADNEAAVPEHESERLNRSNPG